MSGIRWARTVFWAASLAGTVTRPALAAQRARVEWQVPDEVGPDDRRAILAIARAVGIREPRAVSVPMRSRCLLVRVESTPVLLGNRVSSEMLGIRKKAGPECQPVRGDRLRRHQEKGNWIAFLGESNPRREERWRINDGDWHVDVLLGGGVPYEDAVAIVHAIRRRQLVDRRPPSRSASPIQYVDASRIMSIRGVGQPNISGQYEIEEGTGQLLVVRIRDGRVELHDHLQWMA